MQEKDLFFFIFVGIFQMFHMFSKKHLFEPWFQTSLLYHKQIIRIFLFQQFMKEYLMDIL